VPLLFDITSKLEDLIFYEEDISAKLLRFLRTDVSWILPTLTSMIFYFIFDKNLLPAQAFSKQWELCQILENIHITKFDIDNW